MEKQNLSFPLTKIPMRPRAEGVVCVRPIGAVFFSSAVDNLLHVTAFILLTDILFAWVLCSVVLLILHGYILPVLTVH